MVDDVAELFSAATEHPTQHKKRQTDSNSAARVQAVSHPMDYEPDLKKGEAMNKDRVRGIFDELAGNAKRIFGRLTGDKPLQARGIVQQAKGKFTNALGRVKGILQRSDQKATPER